VKNETRATKLLKLRTNLKAGETLCQLGGDTSKPPAPAPVKLSA
jgi:hypothetical protein